MVLLMTSRRLLGSVLGLVGFLLLILTPIAASAQDGSGIVNWQLSFQEPHSDNMTRIIGFGNYTLWMMALIVLLVMGLLAYCMVKFNAKANPEPSKTSHNTVIEIVWTVVPILILVAIAIPSFRLLYYQVEIPENAITIKAVGYQWYWEYEYPDHGDIFLSSFMLDSEEARQERADLFNAELSDYPRLLAVDNEVVVPVGTNVRLQVTAADVMHAFAMPAFGVKIDAIPGRLNETWFNANNEGLYYGQCSELCGTNHAFMPIAIRVVSEEQFIAWTETAVDDVDTANQQLAIALDEERQRRLAQR